MTCGRPARRRITNVAFLWHNVIGAVAVVVVGLLVSAHRSGEARGLAALMLGKAVLSSWR